MNLKELFKNRGLGYWISTAAAGVALVLAIVVFATWSSVLPNAVTDGYVIGIVLLICVAYQVAVTFFPVRFANVPAVALYTIAFGVTLLRMAAAVADFINQVAYQGGNFAMCMFYVITTLVLAVACVVACFFDAKKDDKYLI